MHGTVREIVVRIAYAQMTSINAQAEIFARVLFSRNFVRIKPSGNGEIIMSFTDIGTCISCPFREFLKSQK